MNKVLNPKKLIYFFLILICVFIVFVKYMNLNDKLPFGLWYVQSDSMKPTITIDDGFILIRSNEYSVNDIITFRPQVLNDEYVTHRIIDVTDDGKYITKGDYNQSTDQEGGEPAVDKEYIVGKVMVINERPFIIPNLGIISRRINEMVGDINVFKLLSMGIFVYLIGYILDTFAERNKPSNKKKLRLIDIAPYFDWVFLILCATLLINIFFLVWTIKSWGAEEIGYVVVSTEGISAPLPGEVFTETRALENRTLFPFVTVMEAQRAGVEVNPKKLKLPPKQHHEYLVVIKAPDDIGYYIERIHKKSYPDLLPDKLLVYLYSKGEILPLVVIFGPVILLNIALFICWNRRWQTGEKEVMGWLIALRKLLKPVIKYFQNAG